MNGSIVTAFLPTIWYYGGRTALSDVPALCAVVLASALLLRSRHSARAFIAGMFVLGIAGGSRPLHIAIATVPAIVAASSRQHFFVHVFGGGKARLALLASGAIGVMITFPALLDSRRSLISALNTGASPVRFDSGERLGLHPAAAEGSFP